MLIIQKLVMPNKLQQYTFEAIFLKKCSNQAKTKRKISLHGFIFKIQNLKNK